MYRYLAALCAFLSCVLIGCRAASLLVLKCSLLRAFSESLLLIRSEIAYGTRSLPEIFVEAAENAPVPLRELFYHLAAAISAEPGKTLTEHLRASNGNVCHSLPKSIRESLTYLSLTLGGTDRDGQLNALSQCEARICSEERNEEAVLRNRCRTYRITGLCVGAAAAILIL